MLISWRSVSVAAFEISAYATHEGQPSHLDALQCAYDRFPAIDGGANP